MVLLIDHYKVPIKKNLPGTQIKVEDGEVVMKEFGSGQVGRVVGDDQFGFVRFEMKLGG